MSRKMLWGATLPGCFVLALVWAMLAVPGTALAKKPGSVTTEATVHLDGPFVFDVDPTVTIDVQNKNAATATSFQRVTMSRPSDQASQIVWDAVFAECPQRYEGATVYSIKSVDWRIFFVGETDPDRIILQLRAISAFGADGLLLPNDAVGVFLSLSGDALFASDIIPFGTGDTPPISLDECKIFERSPNKLKLPPCRTREDPADGKVNLIGTGATIQLFSIPAP